MLKKWEKKKEANKKRIKKRNQQRSKKYFKKEIQERSPCNRDQRGFWEKNCCWKCNTL